MKRRMFKRQLEEKHGDLNKVIPPLVNEGGQEFAAEKLNVAQIWISRWLKDNGYVRKIEWVKQTDTRRAN